MNYYFLPNGGIYGGIKVGFQFVDLLNELGIPCVVVTPDGLAPQWFRSSAYTVPESAVWNRLTESDCLIFSLPHDYERFAQAPARVMFHCQGTVPMIDPIIRDPRITVLTCWEQAHAYVLEKAGRESISVGINIADDFFFNGRPKRPDTAACMPRRGSEIIDATADANPRIAFTRISDFTEKETANTLVCSEYFLATSVGEWFGLPAIEAMAAGCVVVTVPVVGGNDYLRPNQNCCIGEAHEIPGLFADISRPGRSRDRVRLRDHAIATAGRYRRSRQKTQLREMLAKELKCLAP